MASEYENLLKQQLADLQRDYFERAKPIIDRLVELESMKPVPPLVIFTNQIPEHLKQLIMERDQ